MSIALLGIRHHGPGSARAVVQALEAQRPDLVLVEGPPEATPIIPELAHPDLRAPVALLVHGETRPDLAAFFPFAEFSPEWQAMQWALRAGVEVRFLDLARSVDLALSRSERAGRPHPGLDDDTPPEDPLELLARSAGYQDHELWWDLTFERRLDGRETFASILEVMRALREGEPRVRGREALREAAMRTQLRGAQAEGFEEIAVVCGAFHTPALEDLTHPDEDRALLAGLPQLPVRVCWIPWTSTRLSWASGYGAGIESPGWYAHLFAHGREGPAAWVVEAARLLRGDELEASSASVIETVRLAESLAALRGQPLPGLDELRDAILSVLAHGRPERLELVRERLELGSTVGVVPGGQTELPLARDIAAEQKRLRLEPSAEEETLELDLRRPLDRQRSRFLHRLGLLGVDWGTRATDAALGRGTFRERWVLRWTPELPLRIVEASIHGHSLQTAVERRVGERARRESLPQLTTLLERTLWAELDGAVPFILRAVDARAASAVELAALLLAMPPLVRILRYGDVRETRVDRVEPALRGLVDRAVAGLGAAAQSVDDTGAKRLADALEVALDALDGERRELLHDAMDAAAKSPWTHGLLQGFFVRRLFDAERLAPDALDRRVALALSVAVPPMDAARWLEGLLRGGGALLVHQPALLSPVDHWMAGLDESAFRRLLPILRRGFAALEPSVRERLAVSLATGKPPARAPSSLDGSIDAERADRVWPVLDLIFGRGATGAV